MSELAQVAALPVRGRGKNREVLLITSRETLRWVIPKGWPMKGRSDHSAAAQEALEEAGIEGRVHKHPMGAYADGKRRNGVDLPVRVMVYMLEVTKEKDSWLERNQRTRHWFSVAEAATLVSEPALSAMIGRLDNPLSM